MPILEVNDLRTYFNTPYGMVRAVDGVSFKLMKGEVLGLVGESGAGKSVTALTVLGLAHRVGAVVSDGEVWFAGKDLMANRDSYRTVRGKSISLIPQEAGGALNPLITVGRQLAELYQVHLGLPDAKALHLITGLLLKVQLPDPELILRMYPHQLSGGTLQRVLLAMAVCCNPDIVIADEPASSLDTTVQAQVLGLIRDIISGTGMSMILIAHDLGIISEFCDRILVMYGGCVMEAGPASQILSQPLHPYTGNLLDIYRMLDSGSTGDGLTQIAPLNNFKEIPGCVFFDRCPMADVVCRTRRPETVTKGEGRVIACHRNRE